MAYVYADFLWAREDDPDFPVPVGTFPEHYFEAPEEDEECEAAPATGRGKMVSIRLNSAVKRVINSIESSPARIVSGAEAVTASVRSGTAAAVKKTIGIRSSSIGVAAGMKTGWGVAGKPDTGTSGFTIRAHAPGRIDGADSSTPVPSGVKSRLRCIKSSVSCFGGGGGLAAAPRKTAKAPDANAAPTEVAARALEAALKSLRAPFSKSAPTSTNVTDCKAPLPRTMALVPYCTGMVEAAF